MSLKSVSDFENIAKKVMEKEHYDYYRMGAGEEYTLRMNVEAFKKLKLRPRCLRDVSLRDTSMSILGQNVKFPLGISPTAIQKLAHTDGELAAVRAAEKAGVIYILSSLSSYSIEEVAEAAEGADKWLQIFIYKNRFITENLIQRAEKSGFKALVLTIDYPRLGICRNSIRDNFAAPVPFANFRDIIKSSGKSLREILILDTSLTWEAVDWLIKSTTLPVIVKGVLTKEDALLAIDHKCAGIIVSNHGARQLDGVPASIEALPQIIDVVKDEIPVMIDGGVSQGGDLFKAISLGAKMAFIGRPVIWGLAANGQQGVEDILEVFQKEFEATMDLSGCASIAHINKSFVAHESSFSKL